MSRLEQEIQARTEVFAAELATLIKRAALEAVSEALQRRGSRPKPRQESGRPTRIPRGPRKAKAATAPNGGKRSSEVLTVLSDAVLAEVAKEPGRGIEAIAAAIGVSTKELALPVKKLLSDGKLRRRGQRRATSYYATT